MRKNRHQTWDDTDDRIIWQEHLKTIKKQNKQNKLNKRSWTLLKEKKIESTKYIPNENFSTEKYSK